MSGSEHPGLFIVNLLVGGGEVRHTMMIPVVLQATINEIHSNSQQILDRIEVFLQPSEIYYRS